MLLSDQTDIAETSIAIILQEGSGRDDAVLHAELAERRLQFGVQCAVSLGAYLEFLPPMLGAGGAPLVLRLLDAWRDKPSRLHDALQWLASLLAHRK